MNLRVYTFIICPYYLLLFIITELKTLKCKIRIRISSNSLGKTNQETQENLENSSGIQRRPYGLLQSKNQLKLITTHIRAGMVFLLSKQIRGLLLIICTAVHTISKLEERIIHTGNKVCCRQEGEVIRRRNPTVCYVYECGFFDVSCTTCFLTRRTRVSITNGCINSSSILF